MSVLRFEASQQPQELKKELLSCHRDISADQLSLMLKQGYLDRVMWYGKQLERLYTGAYVIQEKNSWGEMIFPPTLCRTELTGNSPVEAYKEASLQGRITDWEGWPFFPTTTALLEANAMQALAAYGPQYYMTAQQLSVIKSRLSKMSQSTSRHFVLLYYTQAGDFTTSITGLSRKKRKELYGTGQKD